MKDINQGNQDILSQVEDSNKQINEILVMISEIGTKTKLINDIVFQTKLLSFNASVEAARAGENVKGFAVVAEEVGNLAQSSGNSAREISELLSESIGKVEGIIRDTTSKVESVSSLGRERVKTGQETVPKCSVVFDEIVKSFNQVSALVSEISNASNEQNVGMLDINKAMARLNVGTDKSTQMASESSQAATQLESRAKTLREVVQNIQRVIHWPKERERWRTTALPSNTSPVFLSNAFGVKKIISIALDWEKKDFLSAFIIIFIDINQYKMLLVKLIFCFFLINKMLYFCLCRNWIIEKNIADLIRLALIAFQK